MDLYLDAVTPKNTPVVLVDSPRRMGKMNATRQLLTEAMRNGKKVTVLTMGGAMSGEKWLELNP